MHRLVPANLAREQEVAEAGQGRPLTPALSLGEREKVSPRSKGCGVPVG